MIGRENHFGRLAHVTKKAVIEQGMFNLTAQVRKSPMQDLTTISTLLHVLLISRIAPRDDKLLWQFPPIGAFLGSANMACQDARETC